MLKPSENRFYPQSQLAQLVLSDAIEELAEALKEKLFFSGGHPFDRRVVIVPNFAVKRFLEMRFAEDRDVGISAGVEILLLSSALSELLPSKQPSIIELTFQIEAQLSELIENRKQMVAEESLAPLWKYIEAGEEERLSALSGELAELFLQYSRFGGEFLQKWVVEEGWQQFLWKRCFFPQTQWVPLSDALQTAPAASYALYLFHFSTLSRPLLSFFNRCNATYFLFSPSPLFWGDFCSSKERAFLHRALARQGVKEGQRDAIDKLLDEQNPLFANLSKGGRDFQNLLIDDEVLTEERYIKNGKKEGTLLRKLQNEISQNQQDEEKASDSSIQIHAAMSRLHEVEIFYEGLVKLFTETAIQPKDVLVLAPDVSLYLPYFQLVFGLNTKLNFADGDLPKIQKSDPVEGIDLLMEVCKDRFDVRSVFSLFAFPPFAKKFDLDGSMPLYKHWIEQANIRWGVDEEMRRHFLKGEAEGDGTWEEGFGRLLQRLALLTSEEESSFLGLSLEKNEIERLGLLIQLIRSLKRDLAPIVEKRKMPVSLWLDHFAMLLESYFTFDSQERELHRELSILAEGCRKIEEPLPFASVIKVLQRELFQKKRGSFQGAQIDQIRFGNLQEGAALPARAIFLLGMEEGVFPRNQRGHPLSALSFERQQKNIPSQAEEDRYLFLQLLLCARDFFILSFVSLSPEDGKTLLPSLLIQELHSYLKCTPIAEHSAPSPQIFDSGKTPFVAAYFCKTPLLPPNKQSKIELKDLRRLAKNPLQFYFNETLELFLPWEGAEEEFSLSPLVRTRLMMSGFKKPLEPLLKKAETEGLLPYGAFGKLAERKLLLETQEIRNFLANLPLASEEIWEIEWKEGCKRAEEWKKGGWIVPALKISLSEEREVILTGVLSGASTHGLIIHGKESSTELFKAWPDLLLYSLFTGKNEVGLLFLKDQKRLNLKLKDPLLSLKRYIEYYLIALENPSPFFPEWGECLLHGTEEELQKKITAWKTSGVNDPYRDWLFWRDGAPSAAAIFNNWTPALRELFAHLPEEFF